MFAAIITLQCGSTVSLCRAVTVPSSSVVVAAANVAAASITVYSECVMMLHIDRKICVRRLQRTQMNAARALAQRTQINVIKTLALPTTSTPTSRKAATTSADSPSRIKPVSMCKACN
jgi:hypothetical protein